MEVEGDRGVVYCGGGGRQGSCVVSRGEERRKRICLELGSQLVAEIALPPLHLEPSVTYSSRLSLVAMGRTRSCGQHRVTLQLISIFYVDHDFANESL